MEEIINIISTTLDIDKSLINENTNLAKDLEVDSLDLVDLINEFETSYNIVIEDKDIKNLQTVKDIYNYLNKNNNE